MPGLLSNLFGPRSKIDEIPPRKTIMNYVWINARKTIRDETTPLCCVPLHYIDNAIENARKNPTVDTRLWVDHDMLDRQSLSYLQDHLAASGARNLTLHDLRAIPSYAQNSLFDPDKPKNIWLRVDLARLLAVRHCLSEADAEDVFYSDFDINGMFLNHPNKTKSLNETGLALVTQPVVKKLINFEKIFAFHAVDQQPYVENSYFGIRKSVIDPQFLDQLITASEKAAISKDVYRGALYDCFLKHAFKVFADNVAATQMAVPAARDCYYKIPVNPHYIEAGINARMS